MLIGSRSGARGDDPDLIQGELALAQGLGAARELLHSVRDGGEGVGGGGG